MEPISSEVVEKTWQRIGVMDPQLAHELIGDLENTQPVIMEYLMAGSEELFNQAERELVIYLGIVIWQIMKDGFPPPPQVLFEDIEKAEAANLKMLEYLGSSTPGDFSRTVETVVVNYSQPQILRYVVEALFEFEEDEDVAGSDTKIRDDMKGIIFIVLKTIIDCLDR
ncbi:MAG TPA: hypothetical protein VLH40_00605 [Atribacteraceae bacterium]|nr:hypothetical protein [Atribacteraceae bacterium]